MKKGSKEMLKTILGNQELIMKALKIEVTVKKTEKAATTNCSFTAKNTAMVPKNKFKRVKKFGMCFLNVIVLILSKFNKLFISKF